MMASRKKTCTCGKIIGYSEICKCKNKESYNKSKREYYQKNKEAIKELNSGRWRKKRQFIIKRDNSYCQRCLHKFGIIETNQLQVHHIKPRTLYPELIYVDSNLVTLCKICNTQLGIQEQLDFEWEPPEREFTL